MSGLRLVMHNDVDAARIEFAGSLSGADVESAYQAWQSEAWSEELKPVIVDITSVTEADQHGRALLVLMYRFGSQIVAGSRESSALAQTIGASVPRSRHFAVAAACRSLLSRMFSVFFKWCSRCIPTA